MEWVPDLVDKPIAEGATATIYWARVNGARDPRYVVKQVTAPPNKSMYMREIRLLMELPQHPHVIRVFAHTGSLPEQCILLECGPQTTLEQYASPMTPMEGLWVTRALFSAVDHLHNHDFAHCDIKPSNVLVDLIAARLFLIDFGLARRPGQYHRMSLRRPLHPSADSPLYACIACGSHSLHVTQENYACMAADCRYTETLYRDFLGTPYFMPLEMLTVLPAGSPPISLMRTDLFCAALTAVHAFAGFDLWRATWEAPNQTVAALRKFRRANGDHRGMKQRVKSKEVASVLANLLNVKRPCDRPRMSEALQRLATVL
jgi:serine/threonine protein kinase